MNRAEAAMLCRYVTACCPQQKLDEYSPDAWADLLGDLRYQDCKEGAGRVARRQPFVSPSEIRGEVRRIRAARVDGALFPDPPSGMDAAAYIDWLKEARAAIADGDTMPMLEQQQLRPRPVTAAIRQIGRIIQ